MDPKRVLKPGSGRRLKGCMGNEAKLGQLEAVSQIRSFLAQRGLQIPARSIRVMNEENWLVFERGRRSVGVDREAGVWQKDSPDGEWRCSAPRGAKMEWMENPIACTGR